MEKRKISKCRCGRGNWYVQIGWQAQAGPGKGDLFEDQCPHFRTRREALEFERINREFIESQVHIYQEY